MRDSTMRHLSRTTLTVSAGMAAVLTLASCGGGGGGGGGADGEIELTIATFGSMGYEALLEEYEEQNPGITIVQQHTGRSPAHHQNLFQKLGAGSGLSDIEAVEEGHMARARGASSRFNDLTEIGPEGLEDRWQEWKYAGGQDAEGRLIGYGTDMGPLAMCYRQDLFEEAGLPSDPEEVAPLFETWEAYFEAGDEFTSADIGSAWFDNGSQVFNAMNNQLEFGYYDAEDNLIVESNEDVRHNWDRMTAAVEGGQSAGLAAFSNEWESGFADSAFATKTCPAWMMGPIKEHSGEEHAGQWAISPTFPDGGGNWGGTYLTVPTQSEHPEEAAELAAWLTAPEQQIRAFVAEGPFPAQVEALDMEELLEHRDDYFATPDVGPLFSEAAKRIERAQYKGPSDGDLQDNVFGPAIQTIEQGLASPDEAWEQAVRGANELEG
ncbi:cellobiose-binding protein [Actinoalloteichus cyanogriseus DSM 43889]|uniref:Cellobiose-binding protein n=2 Tax=Actinoalloteichus cyanogriseus TaxID=2893586 RepID=A0ABT1JNH4_ACTCY|nr:cellobiose-binding protein [Actinoalloteichus caeruleus DSM 43889]